MPLDVTHKALTRRPRTTPSARSARRWARPWPSWTDFFERFDMEKYGSEGAPLHDPCVIAYLLRPEPLHRAPRQCRDRDPSDLTRGMTVADWWGVTDRAPNATFMGDLDADGFFALV
jgi:purine nucleosidase